MSKQQPLLFTAPVGPFTSANYLNFKQDQFSCIKCGQKRRLRPRRALFMSETDFDNGYQDEFNPSYSQVARELARRQQEGQRLPGLQKRGSIAGERWEMEGLDNLYVPAAVAKEVLQKAWDKWGKENLARILGEEVAKLAVECYGEEKGVFGVVGRGWKGKVAAWIIRFLAEKGWTAAAWLEDLEDDEVMKSFLEDGGIETCGFVPGTLEMFFDVVVEGLFGLGWDGAPPRDGCWAAHHMMCNTRTPVLSLAVPAGWDPDGGPRSVDMEMDEFIRPEILVSFGVPSMGTKRLGYGYHYVVGRIVNEQWALERDICLPEFPNNNSQTVLLKRDPIKFGFAPGEVYGKPGRYMATLFNKNPRRTLIGDIDEIDWITAVE